MNDQHLEESLRAAAPVMPLAVTPELRAKTLGRLGRPRLVGRSRPALATLAAIACLLILPATLVAMSEPILGVHVRISGMSPAEWLRQGLQGWVASPGAPEFLSPEETLAVATFPVRTPSWLPAGLAPTEAPRGAYALGHENGAWHVTDYFFVTQAFQGEGGMVSLSQHVRRVRVEYTLPPGTEILTVAGHPAFLERDQPWFRADAESEERSRRGLQPEVDSYRNSLTIWVEEADGSVTEVVLTSALAPEVLIQIAESLF